MTRLSVPIFVSTVIRPAVETLGLGGQAAEELLLGTAIQETGLRNIGQDGGPALGYFQIEPATHGDLWQNWIPGHRSYRARLESLLPPDVAASPAALIPYPVYAAAIARLIYYRVPDPLPPAGDLVAQAGYYKRWYNTAGGAASVAGYIGNWRAMAKTEA